MNLRERLAAVESELRSLHEAAGDEPLADEAQTRWDELTTERSNLQTAIQRDEARRATVAQFAQRESGDGARQGSPALHTQRDPFAVLERVRPYGGPQPEIRRELVDSTIRALEGRVEGTEAQRHLESLLNRHASHTAWAAQILHRSRPEYAEAWAKLVSGRQAMLTEDEQRAAMAVGTNTAGGYLVPTHLDPTIILTNAGVSNVIRGLSRTVTLTEGNVWNGVTSAGSTASWDAELTEVSDDTPAVDRISVPTYTARAFVQASIQATQDINGLASDLLTILGDAKDRLEAVAHATGSGSGQPTGIFTALDANTNVEVISTTAATIGVVDLHNLYRSVPVRWRGKGTWLMNPLYSLAIKALGTALSASYTTDLTQGTTGTLLSRPVVESDEAPTTQTTTSNDNEVIYGDFSNFVIVDLPGSTAVEYIPHMFNTSNNLPDGRRGWFMYWRNGSDSINDLAFRLLQDKTSA